MKRRRTGKAETAGGEKKINRRTFLKMTGKAGMVAGMSIAAAGFPTILLSQPSPAEQGILRIARQKDALLLDPYYATTPLTRQVYENIFDHLIYADPNMNIKGQLAASWERVDDVTYSFKLQKGVKFHNGRPFHAADVKYSVDRLMGFIPGIAPGRPSQFLGNMKSVEVKDDLTVIFKSKNPYGAFINDLTSPYVLVLAREGVEKWNKDFGRHPEGTGPFTLEEWKPEDHLTLKRFDGYWAGPRRLKKVIWQVIPEDSTRLLAFENNETDMVYQVPPHEVARLKADKRVQVIEQPTFRTHYIMMNVKKGPFRDKAVRQALVHGISGDRVIKVAMEGVGTPAKTFMAPKVFGAADVGMYEYNPQRAQQLLEQAGWKMGPDGTRQKDGAPLSFSLLLGNLEIWPKIAEVVQEDLKKIGVKVALRQLEYATYLAALPKGEQEMFLWSYGPTTPDAHVMLYPHLHSKEPFPTSRRYTFYENPKIDRLLEEGVSSLNQQKRKELYLNVQQIVKDECIWFPLFETVDVFVLKNNIRGFSSHPGEHIRLWDTYYA